MPTEKRNIEKFRFWCQKVLPLVYDDSLSYYEILCKVVDYINALIDSDNEIIEDIEALRADMTEVQRWIDNFDDRAEEIFRQIMADFIPTTVIFGLTNDGYFCAYIPPSWSSVEFDTIYDYDDPLYGHLVLKYD